MIEKRANGQYYTQKNPFNHRGFREWAEGCDLSSETILEPYAGSNNLVDMLIEMGLCHDFMSYDIKPAARGVRRRDTLKRFPQGYAVCITNPPYLASNSAKRRGLPYPDTHYDDLYKYALRKCLDNCSHVGAIIPASFLNSGLFRDRLAYYIMLNSKMFHDTDHPVCLALFDDHANDVEIYEGDEHLGKLSEFERKCITAGQSLSMRFNDPNGALGLHALDNTIAPSIRFCKGSEIDPSRIGVSSRSITRIDVKGRITQSFIDKLNEILENFREETHDVFLTPFKGIRQDNRFRRRLDFAMARDLISCAVAS